MREGDGWQGGKEGGRAREPARACVGVRRCAWACVRARACVCVRAWAWLSFGRSAVSRPGVPPGRHSPLAALGCSPWRALYAAHTKSLAL